MIVLGKHLNKEGKEKIKILKNNMNKNRQIK